MWLDAIAPALGKVRRRRSDLSGCDRQPGRHRGGPQRIHGCRRNRRSPAWTSHRAV